MKNIANQLGLSILIAFSTLYFFSGIFQLYPMSGWVDAGMYTGAKLNFAALAPDFKSVYQLNRLSYVLPGYFLSILINPFPAQKILIYSFYIIGIVSLYFIALSLRKNHFIAFVSAAILAVSPYFIFSLTSGGVGGVAVVYMLLATSGVFSTHALNGHKNYLIISGFFAGMALAAHLFIVFYLGIVLLMYFYLIQKSGTVSIKSRLVYISIGILIAFFILASVGKFFGLKFLFFKSNFGMIKQSLSGLGFLFKVPLSEWFFGASRLFMPIFILFLVIEKYRSSKIHGTLSEQRKLAKLALVATAAPLSFMFFWDCIIEGTLFQTRDYYIYLIPFLLFAFILIMPNIETGKSTLRAVINYCLVFIVLSLPALFIDKYPHILDLMDEISNQKIAFIVFSSLIFLSLIQKAFINKSIMLIWSGLLITTFLALDVHTRKVYLPYTGVDYKEAYAGSINFITYVESMRTRHEQVLICFDRNDTNEVNNKLYNQLKYGDEIFIINYFDTLASHYMWNKSMIDGEHFKFDQDHIKNKNNLLIVFLFKNKNYETLKRLIPYELDIVGSNHFNNDHYQYSIVATRPK